jgi:hypothetical protein
MQLLSDMTKGLEILDPLPNGWLSNGVVWITFVVMLASDVAMFYTLAQR